MAVLLVLALVGVGMGWVWRVEIRLGTWYTVASRPLSPAHVEALGRCESPGWYGWLRALEHDVDVACPAGWVPETLAEVVSPTRGRWLRRISEHPGRPSRQRLRAGLALVLAGEEAPKGLGLLLSDPDVPQAEIAFVLDRLAAAGEEPAWLDPRQRDGLVLRRLRDGDTEAASAAIDDLRLGAALALPGESTGEEALVAAALDMAGFGGGRFERLLERHGAGFALQEIPWRVARDLGPRLEECRDRASAACARLAADLLEESAVEEGAQALPEPPPVIAHAVWAVLYDGDAATVDAATRRFQRQSQWVTRVEGAQRSGRLLGSIAHPRHGFDSDIARSGLTGDPSQALAHRRATPWTSALAAVVLGELSGLPVGVESVGDGVILDVDGRRAGLGPCGTTLTPPAVPGARWPARAVAAQAVIEATGAALRRGDPGLARELAALAERLDPVGAEGVRAVVEGVRPPVDDPDQAAGRLAGALVGAPSPVEVAGAEDDRRQRASIWPSALADWNAPGEGCPSPLGP